MDYEVKYYDDSISGSSEVKIKRYINEEEFIIEKVTLDEIYKQKELGEEYNFEVECYNLQTKEIEFNKLIDIVYHGSKEIYNILTKGELEINATTNHYFVVLDLEHNEDILCEIKYVDIGDSLAVESSYTNIYRDTPDKVYDVISCIKYSGRDEVFSLIFENPFACYFANGFLTSNNYFTKS